MVFWIAAAAVLFLAYLIHHVCSPTSCPCCYGTGSVRLWELSFKDDPCPRCGGIGRIG